VGGSLWTDVTLHDPPNPDTLDRNFSDWNLSARASLLLAYAKLIDGSGAPHPVSADDDRVRPLLAKEASDRARIAQIVQAGGYATTWRPFTAAYGKWIHALLTSLPPGDTADDDMHTPALGSRLAKEHGLFRLVREIPIDPGDVASEMIRLVDDWRAQTGARGDVTDQGPNLFYVCDSGAKAVHVHPWHKLAPSFFKAWQAAEKKREDAKALRVMTLFEQISGEIKVWAVAHPKADWAARDRALNEMAMNQGLYSLLQN
jgi:hypothetical protein